MDVNKKDIKQKGFTVFKGVFEPNFIDEISKSLDNSYKYCRDVQEKNNVDIATIGTVHHLLATKEFILYLDLIRKICNSKLHEFISAFFEGNYILNSFGGIINLPKKPSYVTNIHRDIRFFSGDFPLMLNMLIMVDDFTIKNGATYVLPESHLLDDKPTEKHFYKNSTRTEGTAGDVLFFNSNLWHAAGENFSKIERKAITITFTKPFMKQQMDYCRTLGYKNVENYSKKLKQVLGYYARTPQNMDEWYQKPENRFYRPNQD